MDVYIRHINETKANHFTEIEFTEMNQLIDFVKQSGGFYWNGGHQLFHSYQLVLDDSSAYAEILIGEEC